MSSHYLYVFYKHKYFQSHPKKILSLRRREIIYKTMQKCAAHQSKYRLFDIFDVQVRRFNYNLNEQTPQLYVNLYMLSSYGDSLYLTVFELVTNYNYRLSRVQIYNQLGTILYSWYSNSEIASNITSLVALCKSFLKLISLQLKNIHSDNDFS